MIFPVPVLQGLWSFLLQWLVHIASTYVMVLACYSYSFHFPIHFFYATSFLHLSLLLLLSQLRQFYSSIRTALVVLYWPYTLLVLSGLKQDKHPFMGLKHRSQVSVQVYYILGMSSAGSCRRNLLPFSLSSHLLDFLVWSLPPYSKYIIAVSAFIITWLSALTLFCMLLIKTRMILSGLFR